MNKVYRIKPLEKKSISWEIEMFRENADGSISWFNISDHYRWGQGFVEEDLDCNLPYEGDKEAHCRTDCGWGSELDDNIACMFQFSDDLSEQERAYIEARYFEGGASWLFDGEHDWQLEDDYIIVLAPYQIDLCTEDGTVLEENIKLRTRPKLESVTVSSTDWPFPPGLL